MQLPRGTTLYRCPPRYTDNPLAVSTNGECGPGLYTSASPAIAANYPLRGMLTLVVTRDLMLLDRSTPDGEEHFQATGMTGYDGVYFNRYGDAEVVLRSPTDVTVV